jgi:hypothetical protein
MNRDEYYSERINQAKKGQHEFNSPSQCNPLRRLYREAERRLFNKEAERRLFNKEAELKLTDCYEVVVICRKENQKESYEPKRMISLQEDYRR